MRQGEGKSPCDQTGPFPLSAQLLRETNSLTLTLFAANSGPLPSPPTPEPPYSTASPLRPPPSLPTHTGTLICRERGGMGGVEGGYLARSITR